MGTSKKSNYTKETYDIKYTGTKPILVVCTDERDMVMANGKTFSTGNHPLETFVPMLHFRDAGFTFDIVTATGASVKLEMWAYPTEDEAVKELHESIKSMLESPKKLADIKSIDAYSAIFIPGGHGAMINLPSNADLGKLLHQAHDKALPTVVLCHGPAALLSTCAEGVGKEFAYDGYKTMCFTDKMDALAPSLGYLPGPLPWKCQGTLEGKGMTVLNKSETGDVTQDRELITGDSPKAGNKLGTFATPILVKHANEHNP